MNSADSLVNAGLAALREDSRRSPRPFRREQARAAMHDALALNSSARHRIVHRLLPHAPWPARASLALAASSGVLAAIVVVGALGWNASPGTPLYGVRAARQSVQLALPGADVAALHLQFAEQDLGDARQGGEPAASLAGAGMELAAARGALPADQASPAWIRYETDEAALSAEQTQLEGNAVPPVFPPPATAHAAPTEDGSDSESTPPAAQPPGTSASPPERPEATPSAGPGGGVENSPQPSAGAGDN
jgi:hypothetical protein